MIVIKDVIFPKPKIEKLQLDFIDLEWYEANKTIIRRHSRLGKEIAIKKQTSKALEDGDVLYIEENWCLLVNIKPCDCIVIQPSNILEMGIICFEIGNQHIPIFFTEDNIICVAYEAPLFNALEKGGYHPLIEQRKLLKIHALKLNNKKLW